jgi:steroid delta-isomerase-like uncharacterized protein
MKKLCMILPLALILFFMVGCQDKEAMAELEELKAQAAVEEQNKELVLRFYEEIDKQNFDAAIAMLASEYGLYSPSNSPKPRSREESIEGLKMALRVSPDTNYGVEELYAVGDRVIARAIATGTHEGDLPGFPATGNKFEYGAIAIVRIENGKIIEQKIEFDELGFMMQLGMELKPKERDR